MANFTKNIAFKAAYILLRKIMDFILPAITQSPSVAYRYTGCQVILYTLKTMAKDLLKNLIILLTL